MLALALALPRTWLALPLVLLAAPLGAQERTGYWRTDEGFAGAFGDLLENRLELRATGEGAFEGTLTTNDTYSVTARTDQFGALHGTAKLSIGGFDLTAQWDGDRLALDFRDVPYKLTRLAAPAVPFDLGAVVADDARRWTIAIYIGGDNDLEPAAMQDLAELSAGLPEKGVEVIALVDRAQEHDDSDGDWTGCKVFRARRAADGGNAVLQDLGEVDTADPGTLAGFVSAAFRTFPAPLHAVVVWDHGAGWRGVVVDDERPGQEGAHLMDIKQVRLALRSALVQAGLFRYDLIAFDACMMAQLEAAIEMADLAPVMVASEANVAGAGFPYEAVLAAFAGEPRDPQAIARDIVAAFDKFYVSSHDPDATLAALDLEACTRVATALDRFANACGEDLEKRWQTIARALFHAETYEPRDQRMAATSHCSVDLRDFVRRVRATLTPCPEAECNELLAAIDAAVLTSQVGESRRLSRGIAVWGPRVPAQAAAAVPYCKTAVGGGNLWTMFLGRVHEHAGNDTTPLVVESAVVLGRDGAPTTEPIKPVDGASLRFTASGTGIVQVQQHDLVRDVPGEPWIVLRKTFVTDPTWPRRAEQAVADEVDLVMPTFQDGTNTLAGELQAMRFVVTNGEEQVNATMDLATPTTQTPIEVRARFTHGSDAPVDAVIRFSRAWWFVESMNSTVELLGTLVPVPLVPDAADTFELELQTIADDGTPGVTWSAPLAWKNGLGLLLLADAAGRYRTDLVAQAMSGKEARASVEYSVADNPDLATMAESWSGFDRAAMHGVWNQFHVIGPEEKLATRVFAKLEGAQERDANVFAVEARLGDREGKDGTSNQIWIFNGFGQPSLRILTQIAVAEHAPERTVCWYGPVGFGMRERQHTIAMKALNAAGVLWQWEKSLFDEMTFDGKPR